ncbi:hypothetical protein TRICHSKD4_3382 [Roseibium sp. TrichSKD4]|uniref:hypothetical protein n=1 Tax=Roseibium sp. TrichSKD4 TaxID=744980 RepID=UPI0001E56FDC|nr:hypothetical protein [Roseibium sp. TrichSKD4]EFO31365.1 hypothetical protein TRICHSKD4_3382 [Roseibium sp. TrichSKD4]
MLETFAPDGSTWKKTAQEEAFRHRKTREAVAAIEALYYDDSYSWQERANLMRFAAYKILTET